MDNTICEIVPSLRGGIKINVNGYLMVKDKNRDNKFYWCCEKRSALKCNGRATTILDREQHYLQDTSDHNHAPEASRFGTIKTINTIKGKAREADDLPSQIIQSTISNTANSQEVYTSLPSNEALRKSIRRIRNTDFLSEPESVEDITIPENMKVTLDGVNFLVKDSTIGENRILLFTTVTNIRNLEQSCLWIMDGTFKTVPTLFRQLYTIHARVGGDENSRIMPLVYALMSSKSRECYERLFQDLIDFGNEQDLHLQPRFILTDFEQAAINASCIKFPSAQNKGCLFHLAQSVYRKIQATGFAIRYGTDENFSLVIRQIPALAFLNPADIPAAFDRLKDEIPAEAVGVVQWFEDNYVHGRARRTLRNGTIVRDTPMFPPRLWSVANNLEYALPRTTNSVEAWHRRWEVLVGRDCVGLFKLIKEMQKEQSKVELDMEMVLRGTPRPPQKLQDRNREIRIQTVLNDRNNHNNRNNRNIRSTMEFLRGIAHNISF
jgi:hypothetical protein